MIRYQSLLQSVWAGRQSSAAFYAEHGWFVSPRILPDELLDEAREALDEHWSGRRDRELEGARIHFADWMPGDGDGTRNNEYISLQNLRVRRLAWSPLVGQVAAEAADSSSVRLFDDQFVMKPSGQASAAVGWHVDGDYWRTCTSQSMITAWIPLHDCPAEYGPLVVLDGSHHWSDRIDRSALSFHSADMEALRRAVESAGFEFRPVTMELERGQFSLHHSRSIHGSHPNRAANPRIALAVHLQDEGNAYRPYVRPDGRMVTLFNDRIARKLPTGEPDYRDPEFFPELWPRPAALVGTLAR